MELTNILDACTRAIARHEHDDEVREVAAVRRGDALLVYARTEGPLTREAFGCPWHIGCVQVAGPHRAALLDACAARTNPLGNLRRFRHTDASTAFEALVGALEELFSEDGFHFSDLLDLMDARDVPYAYRAFDTYGALFRPESASLGVKPGGARPGRLTRSGVTRKRTNP
ncbi:hypothetical protein [uncultured Parolsenella sp.]|uniref:hypothetical protein n=1 Tax=uncultured Parolsenella sp. TaxID=2083008 RepID=UPI0027DC8EAD|nr:hypothetical protein [uncultured Parolsenella sp.]